MLKTTSVDFLSAKHYWLVSQKLESNNRLYTEGNQTERFVFAIGMFCLHTIINELHTGRNHIIKALNINTPSYYLRSNKITKTLHAQTNP